MVAVRGGQFELGCPTATGVVLSTAMLAAAALGAPSAPSARWASKGAEEDHLRRFLPRDRHRMRDGRARNSAPTPQWLRAPGPIRGGPGALPPRPTAVGEDVAVCFRPSPIATCPVTTTPRPGQGHHFSDGGSPNMRRSSRAKKGVL